MRALLNIVYIVYNNCITYILRTQCILCVHVYNNWYQSVQIDISWPFKLSVFFTKSCVKFPVFVLFFHHQIVEDVFTFICDFKPLPKGDRAHRLRYPLFLSGGNLILVFHSHLCSPMGLYIQYIHKCTFKHHTATTIPRPHLKFQIAHVNIQTLNKPSFYM